MNKISIKYCILVYIFIPVSFLFGNNYWQQEVNYQIHVSLNDTAHTLNGNIAIQYINQSPDTLSFIYFHLWPNAYKNNTTAFAKQKLENKDKAFHFATLKEKGFIDSLNFTVNNEPLDWEYDKNHIDIAKVFLSKKLLPGDTTNIYTPFFVKLPYTFSRLGHASQSYQISQWYPKPAVYDQTGWHPMPYLDQGEFYSEFGSFDVHITLPKNYVVGATGDLQDTAEINQLTEKSKDSVRQSYDFPKSDTIYKTLHYQQQNIHDFAWFADKRYNVRKSEVVLPNRIDTVTTWAMFVSRKNWEDAVDYINGGIYYYSKWIGDYPYKQATAVEGALSAGGGMEYPNVTVIGEVSNKRMLERVIVHEIGHNWWYGILASNERTHPWMDEGLNSFYERRYFKQEDTSNIKQVLNNFFGTKSIDENQLGYKIQAVRNEDQPLNIPADSFTSGNYGIIVYGKTPLAFEHLMNQLGEEEFDSLMHLLYNQWKFKHLSVEAFTELFENNASQYIGWLLKDNGVLGTTRKIEYKVDKADTIHIGNSPFYQLTITNLGQIKAPYSITGFYKKDTVKSMWFYGHTPKYKGTKAYPGSSGKEEILFPYGNYSKLVLDAGSLEINQKNNTIRTTGILKKIEPIRFQPLVSIDRGDRTEITYSPIAGWNGYDKLMAGVAIYSGLLFPKKFEYLLAPMYGTGSNELVGFASFQYNLFSDHKTSFRQMSVGINAKRFSYDDSPFAQSNYNYDYRRHTVFANFLFKPKDARTNIEHSLKIRSISITKQTTFLLLNNNVTFYFPNYILYNIFDFKYNYINNNVFNPHSIKLNFQYEYSFSKLSITTNHKLIYNQEGKGLKTRVFAGTFLNYNSSSIDPRFRTSGIRGYQDYLFDYTYFERSVPNSSQLIYQDGGLHTLTNVGQTNQWLASINLSSSLPFTSLIEVFTDIAGSPSSTNNNIDIHYDAGFSLILIPELFEIYVPVIFSKAIRDEQSANGNKSILKNINFTFNINLANPFEFVKNLKL